MIAHSFSVAWLSLLFVTSTAFQSPFLRTLRAKVSTRVSSTVIATPSITATSQAPAVLPPASAEKHFVWEKQWYPLAVEEYTDKTKSQALHLLGNDVVLWYDTKQWRVFEDACPHRGVPLSEGRVEKNGELLCAYHAWTFDGEGKCTKIPQTKTAAKETALKAMSSSCAKSYPTMVAQGIIWVWGEKGAPGSNVAIEAALKQPRLIEELSDPVYEGRIPKIHWNFRDIPYGWDMFMENVLDPAHVVVSHHNIIGNRYKDPTHVSHKRVPSMSEIPIEEGGQFNPLYPEDKGFNHIVISPTANNTSNDFRPPCLNKISSSIKGGGKSILVLYATPTLPGYCRHIGASIVIQPEKTEGDKAKSIVGGVYGLPLPAWFLHVAASFFLHQDQVFLHHQERMLYASSQYAFGRFNGGDLSSTQGQGLGEAKYNLTSDPKAYASTYFMPNEMDSQITTFRNWISTKANGGPQWGKTALARGLPPRLPSAQLFDVWDAHTKNCATCQQALKNIIKIRNSSMVLAAIAAIIMRGTVRALVTTGVFSLIALACHGLKGLFYKFEFHHQNNN